jgi:hypothetical protein
MPLLLHQESRGTAPCYLTSEVDSDVLKASAFIASCPVCTSFSRQCHQLISWEIAIQTEHLSGSKGIAVMLVTSEVGLFETVVPCMFAATTLAMLDHLEATLSTRGYADPFWTLLRCIPHAYFFSSERRN